MKAGVEEHPTALELWLAFLFSRPNKANEQLAA
jgi:hypothetical protein